MDFKKYMHRSQERVQCALKLSINSALNPFPKMLEALSYVVLNAGKGFRPMLVYAVADAAGNALNADSAACAVELMHCYSLVHDDLPAMDNDDLRRGKPTCHRYFNEATAILTGDALQCLAFEVLASPEFLGVSLAEGVRLRQVQVLAHASGVSGLVSGQARDLTMQPEERDLVQIELKHRQKTGALIGAAVQLGLLAAGCDGTQLVRRLCSYAHDIGLAYQIQDDILDVSASMQIMGKQTGTDALLQKPTYVSVLGLDGARLRARQLCEKACDTVSSCVSAELLQALAKFVVERVN